MKKILILILAVVLMFSFSACKETNKNGNTENGLEGELEDIIKQIYKGTKLELPDLQNTKVTDETCKYYTGVENLDFKEAIASEPAINAIAHSLVLIRMNEGADIEKAKDDILKGSDPRKWICVGVEKVIVNNAGKVIVLIMSNEADAFHTSFLDLAGSLAGKPISKLEE